MSNETGQVVRSLAGHDQGNLFYVLVDDGDYLLLADGKRRRLETPKRKKRKHLSLLEIDGTPAVLDLQDRGELSNKELRRALAAFRDVYGIDQGGT